MYMKICYVAFWLEVNNPIKNKLSDTKKTRTEIKTSNNWQLLVKAVDVGSNS